MPKAILEFDLPEEWYEHNAALSAVSVQSELWKLDQELRGLIKYDTPLTDDTDVTVHPSEDTKLMATILRRRLSKIIREDY